MKEPLNIQVPNSSSRSWAGFSASRACSDSFHTTSVTSYIPVAGMGCWDQTVEVCPCGWRPTTTATAGGLYPTITPRQTHRIASRLNSATCKSLHILIRNSSTMIKWRFKGSKLSSWIKKKIIIKFESLNFSWICSLSRRFSGVRRDVFLNGVGPNVSLHWLLITSLIVYWLVWLVLIRGVGEHK